MRHLAVIGAIVIMELVGAPDAAAADASDEKNWQVPAITLPAAPRHPAIACTPEELARLRVAWQAAGPAHDVLAARFQRADAAMAAGIDIPPEGGQHNQWYQCEKCQRALRTIDAHHHRCPGCGTVYSGYPYDNVLYGRTHGRNGYRMEDAAWAWAVTGQKRYAEWAARMMLAYADRYLDYPMLTAAIGKKDVDVSKLTGWNYNSAGHMFEQTLNESMWMTRLAPAYDLIHDASVLSDADKETIETRLVRAMADNIAKNRMGKSNWQTWHNAALLQAGAVLGDEAMSRTALLDPENGFVKQMEISVLPEGMWFENSWGYHYYTLMAMTHIAETGRRLGIDLYSHPMLRKMYTLAFDYRMSDGSLPRFGDSVQDTPAKASVNEQAYAAYGDERILSVLPGKPTWSSVMLGRDTTKRALSPAPRSTLIANAGHAILHTNGPGKLSAAMTFGPYGGFHGHFDKLSFVFFGYGKELGVDPGRKASQAYRLPIHTQWYKSTAGHNAVLVDGRDQKPATGKLLAFQATDSYTAVCADAGEALGDVRQRRLVVLTPAYLLIVDELKSGDGREHVYDWLYHHRSRSVACALPRADRDLGDGSRGFAYLQDLSAHEAAADGAFRVDFTDGASTACLHGATAEGDMVFTATGPFRSVEDRVPVVIWRRKAADTVFLSMVEPTGGKAASAFAITMQSAAGRNIATVQLAGKEHLRVEFAGGDGWLSRFVVRDQGGRQVLDTTEGR